METKPFDLGATERVVKFFGGDKQKMLQAYQSGALRQFAPAPMDQTLLVAAGMLADHMRSAAQQKATPQQTVAQQTFAPPAPPQQPMGAPPAPPAGLGATPEAAQMQGAMPPMGAPPPPPQEMAPPPPPPQEMAPPQGEMPMMAEGGMVPPYAAGGGLSELPIPDTMFDEPRNGGFDDGYAGGGMVAFADGGYTGYEDFRKAIIMQESGGRYGIPNAQGSGAMGIGQIMPGTARAIAKRIGLPYRPELLAGTDEESREYQDALTAEATKEAFNYGKGDPQLAAQYYFAGPNKKGWGPKTQQYGKDVMGRLGKEGTPMPREVDTNTAGGRAMSLEDSVGTFQQYFDKLPREATERAKKAALEELDPVYLEKQKKLNEAEAITAAGLELMAPEEYRGENILGSIAKAVKTGLSAYGAGKKEQKAAKNAAIRELMAYEELDRKTAIAALEVGFDAFKVGLSADQAERTLDFQKVELMSRIQQAGMDRASAEKIVSMRTANPTQFESIMNIIQNGTIEEKAALEQYMKVTKPQTGMAGLVGVDEMGGAEGPQPVILGSRPA